MKVLPFKIPKPENEALIYQEDKEVKFYNRLHQHEEIQISFIKSGEGTLVVGDSITDFKTGDFISIGSNLPHVFNSDIKTNTPCYMMSLFFTRASFGEGFFDLNEFRSLDSFFNEISYGIKLESNQTILKELFEQLQKSSKLKRFILLFEIIDCITASSSRRISSFIYHKNYKDNEGKRMRDVFDYTMKNFAQNIDLKTIASIANMTSNAFCKYFKQRTNKTYFQLLNEIRIEHSSKLLRNEKDLSIAAIAFQSGFHNISNFNRKFKLVKNSTPSTYRKNLM